MLQIFRRHLKSCPRKADGRSWRRCKCPIHVDGTLNGKPIQPRSLHTENWDRATELAHSWESRGYIEEPIAASTTVQAAVESFLIFLEKNKGLKPQSLENYRSTLAPARDRRKNRKRLPSFSDFCTSKGIHSVNQIRLPDLEALQASWPSNTSTAHNYTSRLKSFWEYLFRRKLVAEDFTLDLKSPSPVSEAGVPLEPEEMMRLFRAARTNQRDYAMVLLLRYSGLRIGDAIMRPVSSLQPDGRLILRQTKTGKYVSVILPPAVVDALNSTPKMSSAYWFWDGAQKIENAYAAWNKRLKKVFRVANIKDGHAHRFRHTFAVEMILSGMDIKSVSELLGHSSVQTTEQHYLSWVLRRQQKLDESVKRAWEFDPVLNSLDARNPTRETHDPAKLQ